LTPGFTGRVVLLALAKMIGFISRCALPRLLVRWFNYQLPAYAS
jgi:hypothetical protein